VIALDKRTGKEVWRALSSDTGRATTSPSSSMQAARGSDPVSSEASARSIRDRKVFWKSSIACKWGLSSRRPCTAAAICSSRRSMAARMLALDEHKPAAAILWSGQGRIGDDA
jgi:hypothetical protein